MSAKFPRFFKLTAPFWQEKDAVTAFIRADANNALVQVFKDGCEYNFLDNLTVDEFLMDAINDNPVEITATQAAQILKSKEAK